LARSLAPGIIELQLLAKRQSRGLARQTTRGIAIGRRRRRRLRQPLDRPIAIARSKFLRSARDVSVLASTPEWAKPILAYALQLQRTIGIADESC
jgi:hypothetical protein